MAENHESVEQFYQLQQLTANIIDPHHLEVRLVDLLKETVACNIVLFFHAYKKHRAFIEHNPYNPKQAKSQSISIPFDDPLGSNILTSRKSIVRNKPEKPLLMMMSVEVLTPLLTPDAAVGCIYAARETEIEFSVHELKLIEYAAALLSFSLERQFWMKYIATHKYDRRYWQEKYSTLLEAVPFPSFIVDSDSDRVEETNHWGLDLIGGDLSTIAEIPSSRLFKLASVKVGGAKFLQPVVKVNNRPFQLEGAEFQCGDRAKELLVLLPWKGDLDAVVDAETPGLNAPGMILSMSQKLESLLEDKNQFSGMVSAAAMQLLTSISFDYFSITMMVEQTGEARSYVLCRIEFEAELPPGSEVEEIENTGFVWVKTPGSSAPSSTGQKSGFGLQIDLPVHISFLLMHGSKYIGNWAFGRKGDQQFNDEEKSFLRQLSPLLAKMLVGKVKSLQEKAKERYGAALAKLYASLGVFDDEQALFENLRLLVPQHLKVKEFCISTVDKRMTQQTAPEFIPGGLRKYVSRDKITLFLKKLSSSTQSMYVEKSADFDALFCDAEGRSLAGFYPFAVTPILMENELYAFMSFAWQDDLAFHLFDDDILQPLIKLISEKLRIIALHKQISIGQDEMSRLMDIVQHDFQTPVKELKGIASLLSARYSKTLAGKSREYLRQVLYDLGAVEQLISSLDEYQCLDQLEKRQQIDLKKIVDKAWNKAKAAADENDITANFPEKYPPLSVYPTAFFYIMSHLLSNAVHAVKECDDPVVKVGVVDNSYNVEFFVRDNGPGISASLQERIFELFYKQSSSFSGGAGLGLAIAEKAVKVHGGHIWATSDGQGAEFRFIIPKLSSVVSNVDATSGKRL